MEFIYKQCEIMILQQSRIFNEKSKSYIEKEQKIIIRKKYTKSICGINTKHCQIDR